MMSDGFAALSSFTNLKRAAEMAAKGKRGKRATAEFEYNFADEIILLRDQLINHAYRPGLYRQFYIHEPKKRLISAAPFRDRVVHHAYCQLIEPRFERIFIPHSYANRRGKGTHRAIAYAQSLARRYRYVLRLDIAKYFDSIDHQILLDTMRSHVPEEDILVLMKLILHSGEIARPKLQPIIFPVTIY